MPFDVSEEQSLLTSMLSERDAQISTLTHQLHSTSELLHTTQKELQSKSSARKAQREEHSATIKRLKEEHAEQRRVLAKFEQNVKSGGGLRVHEYAALMRSANSNRVESSYVIRLQAQLCRAMHSLGVMESQLALVKENCSSLIKFMKEDLSHMVDDRTRREIELMNGLARVDAEKRAMAGEMEAKMQEKEELLDQVRDEYEELGLEYDESEVKKALEVKYLLEQMEKVREDKVRLEKELLAALLEREEQINRLKGETEGLEERLDVLKREAEKREIRYAAATGGDDEGGVEQEQAVAVQVSDEEGGEEREDAVKAQDAESGVESHPEKLTLEKSPPMEAEPLKEGEGSQNEGSDVKIDAAEEESGEKTLAAASTDEANVDDEEVADCKPVDEQTAGNEEGDIHDEKSKIDATEEVTQVEKEEGPAVESTDDANVDEGTAADSQPTEGPAALIEEEGIGIDKGKGGEGEVEGMPQGESESGGKAPTATPADDADVDDEKAADSEPAVEKEVGPGAESTDDVYVDEGTAADSQPAGGPAAFEGNGGEGKVEGMSQGESESGGKAPTATPADDADVDDGKAADSKPVEGQIATNKRGEETEGAEPSGDGDKVADSDPAEEHKTAQRVEE